MGEAADDALDFAMRDSADGDFGEEDRSDEDSGYWSEWRKDPVILARHIKSGGASYEAAKLGARLVQLLDPYDGWEPL
jgi:hypothetical protein